jgi:hypothetical protein
MIKIVSKLAQIVNDTIKKSPIIPVKTNNGILVGSVLIENCDNLKNIWQYDNLLYRNVNLNNTAIKIANNLAKYGRSIKNDEIYALDQEYGKWLVDSQLLFTLFNKLQKNKEFSRADIVWAKYCESRDKCLLAKEKVNRLNCL